MKIFLAAIATFGIGCVGGLEGTQGPTPDPDPDPDPTSTARELFDDTVSSTMTGKCGGCHTAGTPAGNVTGFVDPVPTKAYDTIVGYTALVGNFAASAAPVLTKVANSHQGISYTSGEVANITAWLDKEVEERGPVNPDPDPMPTNETPSQVTRRLYKEWSGCFTRADFDAADMAQQVGGWNAQNNTECDNCHATAGEGFLASRDGTFFFDNLVKHTALISQYYIVDLSGGVPAAQMVINRQSFNAVSTRKAPHTEHPTFNANDGEPAITAITSFFLATKAKAATPATCEVPGGRLVD